MKIVVFENESWVDAGWPRLQRDHEILFLEDFLTPANVGEHTDAQVVSTDLSRLDSSTLDRMKRLKLIVNRSTGVDNIDLEYCTARTITVCNVPSYAETAVSEYVFALLLAISRNINKAAERTRRGIFSVKGLGGFDLNEKTLAIIGTGAIGRRVAEIAIGFGMKVVAFDLYPNKQWAGELDIEYMPLKNALARADVVTLHVPATAQTVHMLSGDQFAAMKKNVVIINTARGELIDAQALVRALADGKVAAAGLDVLAEEQMLQEGSSDPAALFTSTDKHGVLLANQLLLQHPRVLATPHCAFFTREAAQRIMDTTIANIEAFIKEEPQNVVVPK